MSDTQSPPTTSACQSCAACASGGCSSAVPVVPTADAARPAASSSPAPSLAVLSTLNEDGGRRWLRPRLARGRWWARRRGVAYGLMIVFVVLPYVKVGGQPLVLLDVVARQFTVLGRTFYPTDSLALALLVLSVLISVILVTAIGGRAWCGWACPQTVYMEFLFRPIDRLFEGTVGKGGKPSGAMSAPRQLARVAVYGVLSMFLAHTFLAYFVGVEQLGQWVRSSPWEHPTAFLVMACTTGLMLFDFLYFREQMCTIACPYGRLQSTMLDEQSLIVAYDHRRGEPRQKGKRIAGSSAGDCVDCNQCVVVCPTGIDIRDGLQMECINCTQCIDACDSVMQRVGLPPGLIRFSSQDAIEGRPNRFLRTRTVVYPLILLVVLGGLGFAIASKAGFDARVLRGKGMPFSILNDGRVSNVFQVRLVNRTTEPRQYAVTLRQPAGAAIEVMDTRGLRLEPGETVLVPVRIQFASGLTLGVGRRPAVLEVRDDLENERSLDLQILGPR